MPKFFITTPIYYVNDVPHIGSAYTTLSADVLARAHRQFGDEVRFITGTDEHGAKIAQKAAEVGKEPQQFADEITNEFQKTWDSLGITYDQFVRTTNKNHEYLAGRVIQELYDAEYIYPGKYEGWYCVACEEYKDIPASPAGGKPGSEPSTPLCEVHSKPLELVSEEIYYFKLSQFQDELIKRIETGKFQIEPESRKNEVLAFLKGEPLRNIPVTRSKVSWGIPVPFAESQTIYVWFEALLNYLSFSGAKIDPRAAEGLDFEKLRQKIEQSYWPADLQLIGKDILRFHAVIWPAMLLALDLPLPKQLFVHGFFTINGEKMSKSKGNVIRPKELVDRYGADAARYLIVSAFPFGADGDISLERFDAAYTSDLANGLGNLLQRTIVLINKFGIKPQTRPTEITQIKKAYLANDLTEGITQTFLLVSSANQYLAAEQPWSMENDALRETVLVKAYEQLQQIAEALTPLMPETSKQIKKQLDTLEPEPLFPRLA